MRQQGDPRFEGLSAKELEQLPIDQLALLVLRRYQATNEWNTGNFLLGEMDRFDGNAKRVLREALDWLTVHGYLSLADPKQSSPNASFITRAGLAALERGVARTFAERRLDLDLHHRLERVRPQFLLGEYELAAFAAMREVEIYARELSGRQASDLGVKLMRDVWSPDDGALTDPALDKGERVALMELFAGAIGTFKNPPSHRQVDYDDPTEAAEVVLFADLLLRILDRTASRLGKPSGP